MRGNPNFHRPLHILVHGDKSKAYRWIQWARNKLDRLQAVQWLGTKTYRPRRDIFVVIQSHAAEKKIIIWTVDCRLYMESGILDMLEIAPLHQDTAKPAQLRFTDTIKADRGPNYPNGTLKIVEVTPGVLDGANRAEGESDAIGCSDDDKLAQLVLHNPLTGQTNTYEDATKPWCPISKVYDKKRAQVRMPASRFTGLLQRHVQAVYGSKRDDYRVDESLGIDPQVLEWTPEGWNGYGDGWFTGTGLFRGPDYRYWLIFTVTDGVYARRMHPAGCGVRLRQWLINNQSTLSDDQLRRYEAYLLSTLEQDEEEGLVKIKEKDFIFPLFELGSPWWYGWHWNDDGSEGHAILIRHKPGASFGGADHFWQSTHVRISIAEHSDKTLSLAQGRLLVGWGIEEQPTDFTMRNNQDMIWWPNPLAGMEAFVPKPLNTNNEPDIDSDTPQYCFYDQNDDLVVVRFQRETIGKPWSDVKDLPAATIGFFTTCGMAEDEHDHSADAAIRYGFYTEGGSVSHDARAIDYDDFTGAAADIQVLSKVEEGVAPPGGTEYDNSCSGAPWAPADRDFSTVNRFTATGGTLTVSGVLDIPVESLLVLPDKNASAVYMGRLREFNGGVGSTFAEPTTRIVKEFNVTDTNGEFYPNLAVFTGWAGSFVGGDDAFSVKKQAQLQGTFLTSGDTLNMKFLEIAHLNRFDTKIVHNSVGVHEGMTPDWLYFPRGSVLAPWTGLGPDSSAPDGFSKGLDETFDWGEWSNWFDPPLFLLNPFILERVSSWASHDGAYLFENGPGGSGGRTDGDFDQNILDPDLVFSFVGHA